MPVRFDAVAEQIAPATLPCAMEVRAIEDCTVEGNVQRKITPNQSKGGNSVGISP